VRHPRHWHMGQLHRHPSSVKMLVPVCHAAAGCRRPAAALHDAS
jgi:hypothetical protein